jgi:hypothetical protein
VTGEFINLKENTNKGFVIQVKAPQNETKEIPIETQAFSANKSKVSASQDRVKITYAIVAKEVLILSISKQL